MAKKKSEVEEVDLDHSLNECTLRGRISAPATERELPSGDRVVEFRLIINRDSRDGVDTLDIASWSARTQRTARSLVAGEWVEVNGFVRRRFWQSPGGLASRWQIEAATISRI